MNKFYITTAIAYTSQKPHIGNTYEVVLADAVARFQRLLGKDVYFLTGTDEHGQKIQQNAEAKGMSPKEYVDEIAGQVKSIWDLMGASYDKFIRTTDEQHVRAVQNIFNKLYEKGDIYKGEYEGLYCIPCEGFFTETQLVDGCCPDCGRAVTKTKEEAYFFKMSKYQDALMKHIEENPNFIQPESRKKEIINNFLKPGLQDLCVSRTSFTWGIPVPFENGHVIYVWVDALSNYITALGFDTNENSDLYRKYWPCDLHIIGKDILRFHAIYWPIFLMSLGEPLPEQIFAHPWLLFGNDKMSKSRGNVMYADDLVRHFGVDAIRFYVLSEMPYGHDGSITYASIISRYNSELANTLGNLVNRTVAMIQKYFDGTVERCDASDEFDNQLREVANKARDNFAGNMNQLRLADAIDSVWDLVHRSNKYIDETTPWALAKDEANKERLACVLYHLAESIRFLSVLLSPLLPETAEKIRTQLGSPVADWASIQSFGAMETVSVTQPSPLFARIDEVQKLEEILAEQPEQPQEQPEQPQEQPEQSTMEPIKPQITMEDFAKLDLRLAKVVAAQPIEKTDKLLQLTLDLGGKQRTVVSGIAKHYTPQQMIGKNVIVVANLAPAKLRGVTSEGLVLASVEGDSLVLATVEGELSSGTQIG